MRRPPVTISTVLTAASSYDLIDIATLKTLLGVTATTYDALFALLIHQASTTAQSYCNNPFVVETIEDQVFPGSEGWPWTVRTKIAPLQLSRWPLTSIGSVVETIADVPTTLALGTDYLADMKLGQLTRLDSYGLPRHWGSDPVVVQYGAGYQTIPNDVLRAVADLVKLDWYAQLRDPAVRSQNSPGVYEASYVMGTGPGGADDMSASATAKLDRYRVPVIA